MILVFQWGGYFNVHAASHREVSQYTAHLFDTIWCWLEWIIIYGWHKLHQSRHTEWRLWMWLKQTHGWTHLKLICSRCATLRGWVTLGRDMRRSTNTMQNPFGFQSLRRGMWLLWMVAGWLPVRVSVTSRKGQCGISFCSHSLPPLPPYKWQKSVQREFHCTTIDALVTWLYASKMPII